MISITSPIRLRSLLFRSGQVGFVLISLLLTTSAAIAGAATGTVLDAQSRTPLRAMVVAAYRDDGTLQSTATTDSGGSYTLSMPAGQYRLLAYDLSGTYATTFAGDAESFESSLPVPIGFTAVSVNFALQRGGTINGRILAGSTPIGNATVSVYNLSGTRRGFAQTDATGAYSIVVPAGSYKLVAYDANGVFAPKFFRDANSFATADVIAITAQQTKPVDLLLQRAGIISGTVLDSDTGWAVPAITVFAYDLSGNEIATAITGGGGDFQLRVPGSSYKILAADPQKRYATSFQGDATSFEGTPSLTINPQENKTVLLRIRPGGKITGHVLDAGGAPLPAITVSAYNLDGTLRADTVSASDGLYTLVLPRGEFKLAGYDPALTYAAQFYSHGNSFQSAARLVAAPGTTISGIDFSLPRAARVSGAVTDKSTGIRLPNVSVAAYDSDGILIASTSTNVTGQYSFALGDGSYRLLAFDNSLTYATAYAGGATSFEAEQQLVIAVPQGATVDFQLSRGVLLSGTVFSSAGLPVTGVQVSAIDTAGNRVSSGISAAGHFAIALLPGSYRLAATDPQHRYLAAYYDGASTLAAARTIVVQSSPISALALVVTPAQRRRAAGH
ncbi:MAG: carboxypeptidase-like regulatory domain-containing protein [Acidobacteriota bacterium]